MLRPMTGKPTGLGLMPRKRTFWVLPLLAAIWVALVCWQGYEHARMREAGRGFLRNRVRDISNTLGIVIRSQGHMGMVLLPRLEAALEDLVTAEELEGVALLNADGDLTVSAGTPIDLDALASTGESEDWGDETVTIVSPVDLGANATADLPPGTTPIIVSFPEDAPRADDSGPREELPPSFPRELVGEESAAALRALMSGEPLSAEEVETFLALLPQKSLDDEKRAAVRSLLSAVPLDRASLAGVMVIMNDFPRPKSSPNDRRAPFPGRPPWMSEAEHEELTQKQGVHWFVLAVSKRGLRRMIAVDLTHRVTVCVIALLAVVGLGMAWRGAERTTALGMKLLRASEMNVHLQDMNLAAAGLAHETKNPLNIVRGLAHYIAREPGVGEDTRDKATTITEEVDRVTERLNQFMDYSRPLTVKLVSTDIKHLITDVLRVLDTDMEDKAITCEVTGPGVLVEADEALLRQVIFNLLLNAAQFAPLRGRIEVELQEDGRGRVALEVRDDGPGIPDESREEIYRPYYTTSDNGTGLGLAVVRQIVLAHQWDIEHISRNHGAAFRVSGIRRL
jgi:signal transduction histidine kinase